MRYTVGYCLYPHGQNDTTETRMRIIFDDGLPATELNRHLVMAQFNRDKPLGTTVYQLCIYLNYLDMHGLEAVDATMDMIYDFLCELYVDGLPYGCNNEPKSYNTICDYVETLSKLYDTLALRGYHLDSSLYTQTQKMMRKLYNLFGKLNVQVREMSAEELEDRTEGPSDSMTE